MGRPFDDGAGGDPSLFAAPRLWEHRQHRGHWDTSLHPIPGALQVFWGSPPRSVRMPQGARRRVAPSPIKLFHCGFLHPLLCSWRFLAHLFTAAEAGPLRRTRTQRQVNMKIHPKIKTSAFQFGNPLLPAQPWVGASASRHPGESELPEGSCLMNKRGEKIEIWGTFYLGSSPIWDLLHPHRQIPAQPHYVPSIPLQCQDSWRNGFSINKLRHRREKRDLNDPQINKQPI